MESGHGLQALGHHQLVLHNQQQQQRPSRYGLRGAGGGGEIVEVQGGHIVRSTGRKDRHSKVCTAKGPRDRRVRLSAHTAIQFYDVQDRLGYDRPSKAVDWLIKNAKSAIDQLAELPPWSPTATKATAASSSRPPVPSNQSPEQPTDDSSKKAIQVAEPVGSSSFSFGGGAAGNSNASFLPPSLDSDAIADTIKSFFPMAAATSPSSSTTIGFQNYPPDLLSRTSSHSQDLRLSLQSFPDAPAFHHPQSTQQYHNQSSAPSAHGALFSAAANLAFDMSPATWAEQNQRMFPWNAAEASGGGGGGGSGGYLLGVSPSRQAVPLHSVIGQGLFFSQRGPLQSSNSPSARVWTDSVAATVAADHQMLHPILHQTMSSAGFTSGAGFSGFRIPARIQGEEEHDGISDKPPSASSASHH